jgi:predicted site-specific integrase-resolvase
MAYVPLRKAVEFLGLHPHTLRKYADEGKIESIKNEAGQRLYNVESYQRGATRATVVCYCRVSSTKQRDDLARQVEFMRERYADAEIIQDIGSGLNFKRKGLQALLVRLMRGDKLTVVVACKDRLCRFRFELFQFMAEQNGGRVVVQGKLFTAQKLNLRPIFLPSFTSSLVECMDCEVTVRRSRKIRLF